MSTPVTPVLPAGEQQPPAAASAQDVSRLQSDLAKARSDLDKMQRDMVNRQIPPPAPAAAPPTAAVPDPATMNREFLKNPVPMAMAVAQEVLNRHEANRVAAGPDPSFDTLVAVARGEARKANPELWDKFQPEIEAKMGSVMPQWRTNATVWTNAFKAVIGDKTIEGQMPDIKPRGPSIRVSQENGPAASTPADASGMGDRPPQLTADEKAWARKFGISDKEYADARVAYDAQDPLGAVNKASPWDKHITFRSSDRIRAARETRKREREKANAGK